MLIIAGKQGQLANRLFVSTQFIACAMEHNLTLLNPAFDEYAAYFKSTRGDLFCRYPVRSSLLPGAPLLRRSIYQACYYLTRALVRGGIRRGPLRTIALDWDETFYLGDPQFLASLKSGRLLFAQGWLFHYEDAVARHADRIREYFQPLDEFTNNVSTLIRRARAETDVLVGVHIRHGDYRTFQGGKYFYGLDVYAELMERVAGLWPGQRVTFLVCSNAEQDESALSRFRWLPGTNHFIEDLYSLAGCDYLLGPPSTYTRWASFYGEVPLYLIEDPQRTPTLEDFFVMYGDEESRPPAAGESRPAGEKREVEASA